MPVIRALLTLGHNSVSVAVQANPRLDRISLAPITAYMVVLVDAGIDPAQWTHGLSVQLLAVKLHLSRFALHVQDVLCAVRVAEHSVPELDAAATPRELVWRSLPSAGSCRQTVRGNGIRFEGG